MPPSSKSETAENKAAGEEHNESYTIFLQEKLKQMEIKIYYLEKKLESKSHSTQGTQTSKILQEEVQQAEHNEISALKQQISHLETRI
jgi:arginine deiminase